MQVASSLDRKGVFIEKPKKVAVIGAGTIGTSWATLFATKGYQVNLEDIDQQRLEEALRIIRRSLQFLTESGLANEDSGSILKRVVPTTDLSVAVKDADYVQESAFESYGAQEGGLWPDGFHLPGECSSGK